MHVRQVKHAAEAHAAEALRSDNSNLKVRIGFAQDCRASLRRIDTFTGCHGYRQET